MYAYLTVVSTPSSTSCLSSNRFHAASPSTSDFTCVTSPVFPGITPSINSSVKTWCPRTKSSPLIRPSWSQSSWPKTQTIWPVVSPMSRSTQSRLKSADVRKPRFFTSIDRKISVVYDPARLPRTCHVTWHIASGLAIFDEISTCGVHACTETASDRNYCSASHDGETWQVSNVGGPQLS